LAVMVEIVAKLRNVILGGHGLTMTEYVFIKTAKI